MEDQDVVLTATELRIFDEVDRIVTSAVTSGDPVPAMGFAEELIRSGQVRGLALAKLWYELKSRWNLFQAAGFQDNFEDFTQAHTGKSPQTITKYTRMWENVFANPDISNDIKLQLMGKDIKQLLLLTALTREGVDEETMKDIAQSTDINDLREKIKGERGERTSSASAIRLFVQIREDGKYPKGCLYLKQGQTEVIFGSLDIDGGDELADKAINRVINSSGISEVV